MSYVIYPIKKDGIVIDHLPPHTASLVAAMLEFDKNRIDYELASHLESKKLPDGKSKITIRGLTSLDDLVADINLIALVAPNATISIIRNGKVDQKIKPAPSEKIPISILKCGNPNCISRSGDPESAGYVRAVKSKIEEFVKEGYSLAEAERLAKRAVVVPKEPIDWALKVVSLDPLRVICVYCEKVFDEEYVKRNLNPKPF